jgi:hypothetical protein
VVAESRLERWQRTGVLHLAVAAIVFATWVYFQTQFTAAERPIVLNEVLLLALGWMGVKFFAAKASGDKVAPAPPGPEPPPEPAPAPAEDESGGRHRAK